MAYSNVTFPTIPNLNWGDYPYRAVQIIYEFGAEDWYMAELAVSDMPFYYDTENGYATTDGYFLYTYVEPGESWSTNKNYWGGIEPGQTWYPGVRLTDKLTDVGDIVFVTGSLTRIWTSHAINDTEGNQWLAANSVTPVNLFPEGTKLSPSPDIAVKQGEEHEIQFTLTQNGAALDPTKYVWRVYELRGEYMYKTDAVTVDNSGLVTVTMKTTPSQRFIVCAFDDVLSSASGGCFLRTEAFNLQSFLIGYALGLSGKPLPISGGEPVAYLYNGVRLPKLPEWDKEKYPYVCIYNPRKTYADGSIETVYDLDSYEAIITNCEMVYKESNGRIWYHIDCLADDALYCKTTLKTASEIPETIEWTEPARLGGGVSAIPVWSNHTILNETDLQCPEASEPIPVYE